MLISMDYTNETEHCRLGEEEPFEPFTDDIGELFKDLQREYGRCVSKVYIEPYKDKPPKVIGWVFEKREKYTDCKDTYILHTWVTLHDAEPETEIHYHYHEL